MLEVTEFQIPTTPNLYSFFLIFFFCTPLPIKQISQGRSKTDCTKSSLLQLEDTFYVYSRVYLCY